MTTNAPEGVVLPFNQKNHTRILTCEYFASSVISRGFFRDDNPMRHPVSFLLIQLGAAIILSTMFRLLLRPLKQPRFVSEMLAGIVLGPSMFHLFGKEDYIANLMTNKEKNMMSVLEVLGIMAFSFVVGIRTDITIIKSAGKLPWIMGVFSFLFPTALVLAAAKHFEQYVDVKIGFKLNWVGILTARTSFQVTSFLLEDLSLQNSELGRLALSSALISSMGGWIYFTYNAYFAWAKIMGLETLDYFKIEITRAFCMLGVVFILRPFMFWLMRKIPEGRPIKESHFFVMTAMFFMVSFAYEYLGFTAHFGATVLGLCVPPGPPLASGVVEKLEAFISAVLLPTYIVAAGRYVNIFQISMDRFLQSEILILLAFCGKLAAGVIPSLICGMPYKDSFVLGLLLSAQGFFDVLFYRLFLSYDVINQEMYSVLIVTTVLIEAVITPLIYSLYDPSKRYLNYKRRTIQQSRHENELRILLCLHLEDQVVSLMNVLKASYPTREKPIRALVLELIKLLGRDHPLLINHQFHQRLSTTLTRTDRIINAFNQYELRSEGTIKHQHYTSIAPYVSMHDDICTLALQKRTSILIFPFQKSEFSPFRGVMKNVLDKAPCSVGILVDKKIVTHWRSDSYNQAQVSVCVVFTGGPDAREALAYGMRMAANPAIRLAIVRVIAEDEFVSDMLEARHDIDLIQELRAACSDAERIEYREEIVSDGVDTSKVLKSLDDNYYDLMLVGRRIDSDSPLVKGLVDWSRGEELGIIGDMLASSDMKCRASILVVQQQSTVEDLAHAHLD